MSNQQSQRISQRWHAVCEIIFQLFSLRLFKIKKKTSSGRWHLEHLKVKALHVSQVTAADRRNCSTDPVFFPKRPHVGQSLEALNRANFTNCETLKENKNESHLQMLPAERFSLQINGFKTFRQANIQHCPIKHLHCILIPGILNKVWIKWPVYRLPAKEKRKR